MTRENENHFEPNDFTVICQECPSWKADTGFRQIINFFQHGKSMGQCKNNCRGDKKLWWGAPCQMGDRHDQPTTN